MKKARKSQARLKFVSGTLKFSSKAVQKARDALARARATVSPHGVGYTADADRCFSAYSALKKLGLSKGVIDRIADAWDIPPTPWARARGVAVRSLGSYASIRTGRVTRVQLPKALLPQENA